MKFTNFRDLELKGGSLDRALDYLDRLLEGAYVCRGDLIAEIVAYRQKLNYRKIDLANQMGSLVKLAKDVLELNSSSCTLADMYATGHQLYELRLDMALYHNLYQPNPIGHIPSEFCVDAIEVLMMQVEHEIALIKEEELNGHF